MENAAEGLKYAFAIMVFVIGLTIAFMSISQARAAADTITYSIDKTNFYPQYKSIPNGSNYDLADPNIIDPSTGKPKVVMTVDSNGDRIVGVDTVISNLYRYYTEGFCVIIENENPKYGAVGRVAKFDPDIDAGTIWNGSAEVKNERINAFLNSSSLGLIPGTTINGNKIGFASDGYEGQYSGTEPNAYYVIAEQPFEPYISRDATFKESFVEVNTSGSVLTAPDGSSIQLTSDMPVVQKVYITYTAI